MPCVIIVLYSSVSQSCSCLCLPAAGVEHLLRNVKDATISTLASDVSAKLQALKGLKARLADVQEYLVAVLEGRLPINNDIMTYLQVRTTSHCSSNSVECRRKMAARRAHGVGFAFGYACVGCVVCSGVDWWRWQVAVTGGCGLMQQVGGIFELGYGRIIMLGCCCISQPAGHLQPAAQHECRGPVHQPGSQGQ